MKGYLFPAFGLTLAILSASTWAQLPAARLNAVFPAGGQAGTTVDVVLNGLDLDSASELRFSHAGMTAKKSGGDSSARDEARFTISIAADVPVGLYDCRVSGRFGISNPRVFVVGSRLESTGVKPGLAAASAEKIALDVVINSRTSANSIDYWSFDAKAGQRLMVECDTRSIDSKLNPSLAVIDAEGRELSRSRRTGFIDFTAPTEGTYIVGVGDLLFRGGPEFSYRLAVSTGPHLDSIFPPAGKPGSTAKYTLLGRNLPGGTRSSFIATGGQILDELVVEIRLPDVKDVAPADRLDAAGLVGPSGAALSGLAYRLKSSVGMSNPVAILFTEAEVALEAESAQSGTARNDKSEDAQRLTLPTAVAGRFSPRDDRDWYAFEAKKGETYYIDVVCDRLKQPSAVSLLVQRVAKDAKSGEEKIADVLESPEDETNPGTPAFRTATRDPSLKWEVKEDGLYRLCIRDKFGVATDDPTRAYVLSIRKPDPDFQLVVTPMSGAASEAALWSPMLRKNGVAPLRVNLIRLDGYNGDVTVTVDGLPTGVVCSPLTLGGTDTTGLLALTAGGDVASWTGTLKVVGRGNVGDTDVTRDAICGSVVWGSVGDGKNNNNTLVDPVVSRVTRDISLGVFGDETEPLTITPVENKIYEVASGTKLAIPLTIKRTAELKAALKFKPVGVDGLRGGGGKDLTVDVKADSATYELDLNQTRLTPGTYTICLASPAQVRYTRPGEPPLPENKEKDKTKGKKKDDGKDASLTVYSAPITFKVLPATTTKKK